MAQIDQENTSSLMEDIGEQIEIPHSLPMISVRDVVVFPYMIIPLFVGRDKSVRAVDAAMAKDRLVMLATQKDPSEEYPKPEHIYDIGTVAIIMQMLKLPDGRAKILIQGLEKRHIVRYTAQKSLFRVSIEPLPDKPIKRMTVRTEALMRSVCEKSEKLLSLQGELSIDVGAILNSITDPGRLADIVSSNLRLKIPDSQDLLTMVDPKKRLERVHEYLNRELRVSTIHAKIESKVHEEISKTQREYVLREQLRAIQSELGDTEDKEEIIQYRKKILNARMPKEAEKEALKQLKRLEQLHPDAGEVSIIRSYLDWLVEVPWTKSTKDILDVKKAREILDGDHYNLAQVKDRILEYLSVRKLNKKMKGPILCFVGPPGVGKTSLGRSIAKAMNRKFTRISLGGVRDEAEIRGHRRTYVGALPGRIIQSLKQCETNNPVFMMDEVDKIGVDFRGDPAAALLEILDPEQNFAFSDHYLNIPFDLSKILFITTANTIDPIPSALTDRMELIEMPGYTEEEKLAIAKKFLLPRQIKENGLQSKDVDFSDYALLKIITQYTQEAGLRNLEREIGKICRKTARKIAEGEKSPCKITIANLHSFLGVPKYMPELEQETHEVGVATGLAWTQCGGDILYVEASGVDGKGELILTGQLGEIMRESAQAALTYARSQAQNLGIDKDFYKDLDIHIHVPAGAIPKDGPSAGITMASALVSILTERPINRDVAMTGEITLRGRVLPVGGLKEKALAALRANIYTIIIPKKNEKDLAEIPKNLRKKIRFIPVTHMDEVLKVVLMEKTEEQGARSKQQAVRSKH